MDTCLSQLFENPTENACAVGLSTAGSTGHIQGRKSRDDIKSLTEHLAGPSACKNLQLPRINENARKGNTGEVERIASARLHVVILPTKLSLSESRSHPGVSPNSVATASLNGGEY